MTKRKKAREIASELGVHGWKHLDPLLLASLATESPLLLIGPHGTGKSALIVRMARALGMVHKHYNAALVNYDDLVGIPLPDEKGDQLRFLKSKGTIWDAEFVFLDEISRCRPDMQNKLLPLIHERKIIGIPLENLRHRWAAMNPPAPENPDPNAPVNYYIGSEPLDPALTDRFAFIIPVPNWGELSRDERIGVITEEDDRFVIPDTLNLPGMVAQSASLTEAVMQESASWLADYVICLFDTLEQGKLPQSPRRAHRIARNIAAVHAARMVLEGVAVDDPDALDRSAELAVMYSMPQTASESAPGQFKLVALHRQAWELAQYMEDDQWRVVMQEPDKVRRIAIALEHDFSDADVSRLITQSLAAEDSEARIIALATALFVGLRDRRTLDSSAWEPLAQLAYAVLQPNVGSLSLAANTPESQIWGEIQAFLNNQHENSLHFRLLSNYLLAGFPSMWMIEKWNICADLFRNYLLLFSVSEEAA